MEGLRVEEQGILSARCYPLQMGSFEMRVRRSTKGDISSSSLNGAASNGAMVAPPPASAFASTQSMDIPAGDFPAAQSISVSSIDEDIDDESTIFLTAPKVTHLIYSQWLQAHTTITLLASMPVGLAWQGDEMSPRLYWLHE